MARAEAKYILTAEDRTGPAFESAKARFQNASTIATKAATGVALAAVTGFGAMARSAINSADEIGKLSREIGLSTETLSEMRGVIDLTGGSFQGYVQAIRRMQRSIVDLEDGSKSMEESFASIGLSLDDLQGLSPEEAFDAITTALAGVEDKSLRSARAQEIFGRNAGTVLRLVTTGADEIARLRDEQAEFGNSLDQNATQAAERFNDALGRMQQIFQGLVTQTVADKLELVVTAMEGIVDILPSILRGVDAISKFIPGGGILEVGAGAGEAIGRLAEGAGNVLDSLTSSGDSAVVTEQQETNALLREIRTDVSTARAG